MKSENIKNIKNIISPYKITDFSYEQIKTIEYAINKNFNNKQLKLITNPNMEINKMKSIIDLFTLYKNDEIKEILKLNPSEEALNTLFILKKNNFAKNIEDIKFLLKYDNMEYFHDIKEFIFFYGISKKYIELKTDTIQNTTTSDFILKALENKQIKTEIIDILNELKNIQKNNKEKTINQIFSINFLLQWGFTKEKIKKFVNNNYNLTLIRLKLLKEFKENKKILSLFYNIFFLLHKYNHNKNFDIKFSKFLTPYFNQQINEIQLEIILEHIKKQIDKETFNDEEIEEEIEEIIDLFEIKQNISKIKKIIAGIDNTFDLIEYKYEILYSEYEKRFYNFLTEKLDDKNRVFLNIQQKIEILKGMKNGLKDEDILIYAKTAWNRYQMKEIRKALEENLDYNQILLFASNRFDEYQMKNIRKLLKEKTEYFIKKGLSKKDAVTKTIEYAKIIVQPQFYEKEMNILFDLCLSVEEKLNMKINVNNSFIIKIIEKVINYNDKENINTLIYLINENLLSKEELEKIIKNNNNENIIDVILFFKENLQIYTNFNQSELKTIFMNTYDFFYKKYKNSENFYEYFAEYSFDLIKLIKKSIKENLNKSQIKILFIPSLNYEIKKLVIKLYKEHNLNENQMKLMIMTNFKIPAEIIKNIDIKNDKGRISLILKKDVDDDVLNKLKEKLNIKEIKKEKNLIINK